MKPVLGMILMENKMDFRLNLLLTFILAAVLTLCLRPGAEKTVPPSGTTADSPSAISFAPHNLSTSGNESTPANHQMIICHLAGVAACYQALSNQAPTTSQPFFVIELKNQMARVTLME
jgi:hypothetical protein